MTIPQNQASPAPRTSAWRQIRAGVTHPAGVLFLLLWALAAVTLALRGHAGLIPLVVLQLALFNIVPILVLLRLTSDLPEADVPRQIKPRLWGQAAFLLALIVVSGLSAMSLHKVAPAGWEQIPVWTQVEQALLGASERLLGSKGWLRNPVLHMALPGAVLLLWGVRPGELWLRKGHRSWAVSVPYLILLGAVTALYAAMGGARFLGDLLRTALSHFVQNGFTEEFLFRGALQTRLAALLGEGWGLVLSALVFGVAHLGMAAAMFGGDYLAGLALSIVSQATAGLLFGMIAMRTRSLIAPTVAHVTLNMLG